MNLFVGTAAWNIPSQLRSAFPAEGTHLQRYAGVFNAVEINSSFYKPHKFQVYEKWASSVPDDFRFSVKLSQYFSHESRLQDSGEALEREIASIRGLGKKWGALLIQLPPSLKFESRAAAKFFKSVRKKCPVPVALEPRHESWSSTPALELLYENSINKVLADPEPCRTPAKWRPQLEASLRYFRLHGSPRIYRSLYSHELLQRLHTRLQASLSPSENTWVVFDNSMYGHATMNALEILKLIKASSASARNSYSQRSLNA